MPAEEPTGTQRRRIETRGPRGKSPGPRVNTIADEANADGPEVLSGHPEGPLLSEGLILGRAGRWDNARCLGIDE